VTVVSVSGAKRDLSDLLNRVAYGRERIIVESRGKPKAAVVPIEDYEALEELDELLLSLRVQARMKDGATPVPVEAVIARYEKMHDLDLGLGENLMDEEVES
jgi:prevent-host-death family protein